MEHLIQTEFLVPLREVIGLVGLSSIFLLLRRTKLALLTNYAFALYWGFSFGQDRLVGPGGEAQLSSVWYLVFGLGSLILLLVGLLYQQDH